MVYAVIGVVLLVIALVAFMVFGSGMGGKVGDRPTTPDLSHKSVETP